MCLYSYLYHVHVYPLYICHPHCNLLWRALRKINYCLSGHPPKIKFIYLSIKHSIMPAGSFPGWPGNIVPLQNHFLQVYPYFFATVQILTRA